MMMNTRIRGAQGFGRVELPSAALLLASVAMPAQAQIVPGSTNTDQTEATTSNAPAQPATQPSAPRADDVARPASGATVVENGPLVPQDQGLGTIVVTATKRVTNLQKTPIAISVANSQALADRHANSLFDLATVRSRAFASRPSRRASRR